MVTINTTDDLLRLLDENPEFREAVRQVILTQELIALPAVFTSFQSEMREFQSETKDFQSEVRSELKSRPIDIGVLKEIHLKMRLSRKGPARIASAFSMRRMQTVRLTEYNRASERFSEAIWAAADDGLIDNSEYDRLLDTDLIAQGTVAGGKVAYCAAEASYKPEADDIDKVLQSANILRKVFTDAEVYAAIYCMVRTADNEAQSRQKGVTLLLGQLP